MTFDELAKYFARIRDITLPRAMLIVANELGEYSKALAQDKLGTYQRAVGPFSNWSPLSAVTLDDKRRRGYPTPFPLLRDGELRDSIDFDIQHLGGATYKVSLGSNSPYAAAQEYGFEKIPPRPYMGPAVWEATQSITFDLGIRFAAAFDAENPQLVRIGATQGFRSSLLAARRRLNK